MGTEPTATLGVPAKDKPKDVFKQIQQCIAIDKILEKITSLYNEVLGTNKTEIEVKNELNDDTKLFEFLNEIFVKSTPDKWLEVMNAWPTKTTLSVNPNRKYTLSIFKAGMTDIKDDLFNKALGLLNDKVDIVVFGHTHQPDSRGYGNKKYFNPGSWTRYVNIEKMDSLTLADLANEDNFPYKLNYVKVWRKSGENFLKSEMVTFEELLSSPV
ncbi:hypothetical protein AADEFJLK_02292 [Methylovulum psychrotolerans]|uniref:Calcineurin-like phosphoesterase domain-containing protein n=2 Tax=Methylovulum psychrotolerans TaxID=1704499 RepID=A0A2S5CMM5_9GAMM|nr:hypothetical protein AADEFJLK_02292 [Methylovulum psychrotolerans]